MSAPTTETGTSNPNSNSDSIFPAAVSDRICKHMNGDHAEAVLLYAHFFGQATTAEAAVMESIDAEGMNLTISHGGDRSPLRIVFDRPLADAKEAHVVLVEMMKQAQAASA